MFKGQNTAGKRIVHNITVNSIFILFNSHMTTTLQYFQANNVRIQAEIITL